MSKKRCVSTTCTRSFYHTQKIYLSTYKQDQKYILVTKTVQILQKYFSAITIQETHYHSIHFDLCFLQDVFCNVRSQTRVSSHKETYKLNITGRVWFQKLVIFIYLFVVSLFLPRRLQFMSAVMEPVLQMSLLIMYDVTMT